MSLLQMSIAGAVMILAIAVIRAFAIHRVPKRTFLALWGIALVRLLIPFSCPSWFSIYSLLGRETPAVVKDTPAVNFLPMIPTEQIAAVPEHTSVPVATVSAWKAVWVVGLILCAVFFTAVYRKCYKEFQMSLPVENTFTQGWLQSHPLKRTISIRQSSLISAPLTFGVRHPVILMPKKTDWENESALQYILEHEFVHIRRFDTITKLLLIVAVCVHWFNPLVWVMYVLANRDIELSCDETVVHQFGNSIRAVYAKILISMEETRSNFTPLCNSFSKNAIEERITAIMKTRKTTIISLALAGTIILGTTVVFATSAQAEADSGHHAVYDSSASNATEDGVEGEPNEEYISAGLTYKNNMWYHQGKPVAAMYDHNGGIYTNDTVSKNGIYVEIRRDNSNNISEVTQIAKEQFRTLIDESMEQSVVEDTVISYVNPDDGKTYYSFDNGKTFGPLTAEEYEEGFAAQDIEWWTYEEYKEWLDNEKVQLQSIIGDKGWTGGRGEFVWTQELVDETIAMYEETLKEIKDGVMVSKTVDGSMDNFAISYVPESIATVQEHQLYIKLDNGEEKVFGPYETDAEMLAAIKPFCEKQVKLGNMTQNEADDMIGKYAANR